MYDYLFSYSRGCHHYLDNRPSSVILMQYIRTQIYACTHAQTTFMLCCQSSCLPPSPNSIRKSEYVRKHIACARFYILIRRRKSGFYLFLFSHICVCNTLTRAQAYRHPFLMVQTSTYLSSWLHYFAPMFVCWLLFFYCCWLFTENKRFYCVYELLWTFHFHWISCSVGWSTHNT